jgi:hypothetical protein
MKQIRRVLVEKMDVRQLAQDISYKMNVLRQVPLPPSINLPYLREKVQQYMDPRAEFYRDTGRNPYIEDEFSEYWTAKASNGREIGRGSGGMDVQTGAGEGIDAMCVIMNYNGSNEKSLTQNFNLAGAQLDQLFDERRDVDALNLFCNGYKEKIRKVREENNLTDMYILAYISTQTDVFAVCFYLDEMMIDEVRSGGFVAGGDRNIIANGFIDPSEGNVKLYKSKKRLELRLNRAVLASPYTVHLWSLNPAVAPVAQPLA